MRLSLPGAAGVFSAFRAPLTLGVLLLLLALGPFGEGVPGTSAASDGPGAPLDGDTLPASHFAGGNIWATVGPTQWEIPPIPADFFNPGSEPFTGIVLLERMTAGADTIVERLQSASLPAVPSTDTVPIELVQLSLVSIAPITVTYSGGGSELWDVSVGLPPAPQPQGTMTIRKTHPNGGTFDSTLPVLPRFTFTKVDPPNDVQFFDVPAEVQFSHQNGHWSSVCPPDIVTDPPGDDCFAATHLGPAAITMQAGASQWRLQAATSCDASTDTDCDGVPDPEDSCPWFHNNSTTILEDAVAFGQDTDGDGQGDACDLDDDGIGGIADVADNCRKRGAPQDEFRQADYDGDGRGDDCDSDDDDDGFSDDLEARLNGLPPGEPWTAFRSQRDTPEHVTVPGTCSDGADNDDDGPVDAADPGCAPSACPVFPAGAPIIGTQRTCWIWDGDVTLVRRHTLDVQVAETVHVSGPVVADLKQGPPGPNIIDVEIVAMQLTGTSSLLGGFVDIYCHDCSGQWLGIDSFFDISYEIELRNCCPSGDPDFDLLRMARGINSPNLLIRAPAGQFPPLGQAYSPPPDTPGGPTSPLPLVTLGGLDSFFDIFIELPGIVTMPPDELCDGVDNDADGSIDEGFPDLDGDGQADCLDQDDDGDGMIDESFDNCPRVANPTQGDTDGDGLGNACDPTPFAEDADLDNWTNPMENRLGSDPNDPASTPESHSLGQRCYDGVDNDSDGLTDLADPGCSTANLGVTCGLPLPPQIDSFFDVFYSVADLTIVPQGMPPHQLHVEGPTVVRRGPSLPGQPIPIEIVAMELRGIDPFLGPVKVVESPSQPSQGTTDPNTGDSFFDVFVEMYTQAPLGDQMHRLRAGPFHMQAQPPLVCLPPFNNPFVFVGPPVQVINDVSTPIGEVTAVSHIPIPPQDVDIDILLPILPEPVYASQIINVTFPFLVSNKVFPEDVDVTLTLTVPSGCDATWIGPPVSTGGGPAPTGVTPLPGFGIPSGGPATMVMMFTLPGMPVTPGLPYDLPLTFHCFEPSLHAFELCGEAHSTINPQREINLADNSDCQPMNVPIWVDADVEVSAQSALAPGSAAAGQPFQVDVLKTLHNQGPYGPVGIVIGQTATLPADCTIGPFASNPGFGILNVSAPVQITEQFTVRCSLPSVHQITITNCIWPSYPHVRDPITPNNCASVQIDFVVTAEADLKLTAQVLGAPGTAQAGVPFVLTVDKVMHNNGPFGPVLTNITPQVTAPTDCIVVPLPGNIPFINLPVSIPFGVVESYSIECSDPSFHEIFVTNCLNPADPHVSDPDPQSDCRQDSVIVGITVDADVKVQTQTVTIPAAGNSGPDFTLIVSKTLHNNGPYGPVTVNIGASVTPPAGCTVTPSGSNPGSVFLPVSVATPVTEEYAISCTTFGEHLLVVQNCLDYDILHVVDPVPLNNCRNVTVNACRLATAAGDYNVVVPWSTPSGDDDCDVFTTTLETAIGTDPIDNCAETPDTDDEPAPDAWPFDFNDDQVGDLSDVLRYNTPGVFGSSEPGPPYESRYDMSDDGVIDLSDVLLYNTPGVFGSPCAP